MIRSNPRNYYAEHSDTLHVFESCGERNSFIGANPTAYLMRGSDSKPRRFRDGRLSVYVYHHEDGTVRRVRNGTTTRILEKGSKFGANVPTM